MPLLHCSPARRFLPALMLAAPALLLAPAAAQAQVGVSVGISQPGFYGRIDIGNAPPPPVALIYPQPVLIAAQPVMAAPLYLHVPPGHAKDWRKHCAKYNACGQRVYFVQENWYQQHYAAPYREQDREHDHGDRDDHGHGHGKGHGKRKD